MQHKLQELTEKIYLEGVERGNQEAEKIIAQAQMQADEIIKKAQNQANTIISQSQTKSNELVANAQSEVKLSSRQAFQALKQQIINLVETKVVNSSVSELFTDNTFLKDIILLVIQNWNTSTQGNVNLKLLLPENKEKELTSFFEEKTKTLLSKELTLTFSPAMKNGFQIGPADGSYKISFTDEDFSAYLREYLRPKLISLLFEGDK